MLTAVRVTVAVRVSDAVVVWLGDAVAGRVAVGVRVGESLGSGLGLGLGDGVAEFLGLAVGVDVAVGGWVAVAVAVRELVGAVVWLGLGDTLGVRVGEEVRVGLADAVNVGNVVRVRDGVIDGPMVRVRVGVSVRVGELVRVAVCVTVAVAVTVGVWLIVAVGVGVAGLGVGVLDDVGDGSVPTRSNIRYRGPGLPAVSRARTATTVSPTAKARDDMMRLQYCTVPGAVVMNWATPKLSTVQARRGLLLTAMPQAKSLKASMTGSASEKSGGSKPGTPPSLQARGSPSPRARLS